jgi:hypothetical protein
MRRFCLTPKCPEKSIAVAKHFKVRSFHARHFPSQALDSGHFRLMPLGRNRRFNRSFFKRGDRRAFFQILAEGRFF